MGVVGEADDAGVRGVDLLSEHDGTLELDGLLGKTPVLGSSVWHVRIEGCFVSEWSRSRSAEWRSKLILRNVGWFQAKRGGTDRRSPAQGMQYDV